MAAIGAEADVFQSRPECPRRAATEPPTGFYISREQESVCCKAACNLAIISAGKHEEGEVNEL